MEVVRTLLRHGIDSTTRKAALANIADKYAAVMNVAAVTALPVEK